MGEDRKAVVRGCTMNDTALEDAVATTADAFEKYDDSRDIATYVKKALDKKYGKAWQCIVGRDYGSFITHEPEYFVDFQYKGRTILLFKTIEP
ncbi:unnamed protein product [Calicophoron daubneyi]|uniref:Dynein light chain n=1 Tax=Calicophoron daubneyi TaxID=300641 RepID=A0AAV2TJ71_CALDB